MPRDRVLRTFRSKPAKKKPCLAKKTPTQNHCKTSSFCVPGLRAPARNKTGSYGFPKSLENLVKSNVFCNPPLSLGTNLPEGLQPADIKSREESSKTIVKSYVSCSA